MLTRPMIVSPELKSPDYSAQVRRIFPLAQRPGSSPQATEADASFAEAMAAEQRMAERNAALVSPPAMEPTQAEKEAGQRLIPLGTAAKPSSDFRSTSPNVLGLPNANPASLINSSRQESSNQTVNSLTSPAASPRTPLLRGPMLLDERSLETLKKIESRKQAPSRQSSRQNQASQKPLNSAGTQGLGQLCARYESGSEGIAAVGYDRNGGTSYGKYQISSRQGSFSQFLDYAEQEAPDIAARLRQAGPANTGSRNGALPKEWKAIAAAEPERFAALQEAFIRQSHYDPAEAEVKKSLGVDELSRPLQEALWSTAVQHGPSAAQRLFAQAASKLEQEGKSSQDERALINTLYSLRGTQFGSSTPQVQAAVRQRFSEEKSQLFAMLDAQTSIA